MLWTELLLHASEVSWQRSDKVLELLLHLVSQLRPLRHEKKKPFIFLNIFFYLLVSPITTIFPGPASYLLHPICLLGLGIAGAPGLLSPDYHLGPSPASLLGPDLVVPGYFSAHMPF